MIKIYRYVSRMLTMLITLQVKSATGADIRAIVMNNNVCRKENMLFSPMQPNIHMQYERMKWQQQYTMLQKNLVTEEHTKPAVKRINVKVIR